MDSCSTKQNGGSSMPPFLYPPVFCGSTANSIFRPRNTSCWRQELCCSVSDGWLAGSTLVARPLPRNRLHTSSSWLCPIGKPATTPPLRIGRTTDAANWTSKLSLATEADTTDGQALERAPSRFFLGKSKINRTPDVVQYPWEQVPVAAAEEKHVGPFCRS